MPADEHAVTWHDCISYISGRPWGKGIAHVTPRTRAWRSFGVISPNTSCSKWWNIPFKWVLLKKVKADEVDWRAATALFTTRYTVLDWVSVPSYTVDSPTLDYYAFNVTDNYEVDFHIIDWCVMSHRGFIGSELLLLAFGGCFTAD